SYNAIADLGDDDNDGMTNFWEGVYGFDKDDPGDAFLDADSDGLNNFGEFNAGTDPYDSDSDNDTLIDGTEVTIGSNPLNGDSDGDGLGDAAEITANPYVTNPSLVDTDSDGLDDSVELMIGTDPTDQNSIGTNLVITEFMASNGFSLDDEDGDSSDWIEILNPTGSAIDLSGMALTDDASQPQKWTFPAGVTLPAGEFLVVLPPIRTAP
ncbi:MAG: lamin tail domain-containing protein, partial [Planctomycetaceae bacterium]|nr:lamin tail domain-containing protein [Planctomycetaceae bacterium]